jgi:ABC-type transport system involved in multi-copper enzyme maturation permease subunit
LFAVQTVCAFGLSLLAGLFLTSDCLSEEKREGTLGLLFLTDLKSHDIVLGKFVATALSALYCLLALLPVMPPLPLAPFSRDEPHGVGNLMETGFLGFFFLTISLFADILAVVWFGMWLALTIKRPVALTILFILVLPACLYRFDLVADILLFSWDTTQLQQDFRWLVLGPVQQAIPVMVDLPRTLPKTTDY